MVQVLIKVEFSHAAVRQLHFTTISTRFKPFTEYPRLRLNPEKSHYELFEQNGHSEKSIILRQVIRQLSNPLHSVWVLVALKRPFLAPGLLNQLVYQAVSSNVSQLEINKKGAGS